MNLKKLLFIAIVLFGLISCKPKQERHSLLLEGGTIIKVDPNRADDNVSAFDYFSNIEIIPLENSVDALLNTHQSRFKINGNRFYFLDIKDNVIHVFNSDGTLMHKSNKDGRGPGEFLMSTAIEINPYTNNIEVLNPAGAIYIYDSLGVEYISKIEISFPIGIHAIHEMVAISPYKYLLFSQTDSEKNLFYYNADNHTHTSFNDYKFPKFLGQLGTKDSRGHFYNYKDTLRYYEGHNGNIWNINPESTELIPAYKWDFGEYTFDVSYIEEGQSTQYYVMTGMKLSAKYVVPILEYIETDQFLTMRFRYKGVWKTAIYDKPSHSVKTFTKTTEEVIFAPRTIMYNNELYLHVAAQYVSLVVNDKVLDQKNREILKKIRDEDNDVIIKYTLK